MKDIIIKSMNLFLAFAINTTYEIIKYGNYKPLFLSKCKWENPDKVLSNWDSFIDKEKPAMSQVLGFCSSLGEKDNDALMSWILDNYKGEKVLGDIR